MIVLITMKDIKKYESYIIEKRRDFHEHPEPGFQEFRTSKIVEEELRSFGFDVQTGIGVTGVVGTLKGKHKGKTIALRADMDALQMQEENEVPYKSKHDGVMHACGHDTHTAMLLGAAKYFSEHKDEVNGTIKFIFQSAEEGPMPGGGIFMVNEGVLDNVDGVFGLHIETRDYAGTISIKKGPAMAAPDEFKIKVVGKGTHASAPQTGNDPVLAASAIVLALQSIVSRNISPLTPAVITASTIHGGTAFNIIPDHVEITGTIRTLHPTVRNYIFYRLQEVVTQQALAYGCKAEVEIIEAYPPLINDEKMSDFVIDIATDLIGTKNVLVVDEPSMGGEDFAYYLQKVPGAFFWLGGRPLNEPNLYNNHNPKFDVDESVFLIGTTMHINIVKNFLG